MNNQMMNMHRYLRQGKLYELNKNSYQSPNQQQTQQQIQMSTSREVQNHNLSQNQYQEAPLNSQRNNNNIPNQIQQLMEMKTNMAAMICGCIFCMLTMIVGLAIFYFYIFDYVKDYIPEFLPFFNEKVNFLTQDNAAAYFKQHQLIAGQIHYSRVPYQYWQHRIQMIKSMGMNALSVYVFWNHHQTQKGKFDFSTNNKNLLGFLQLAKTYNMTVLLRPGPYVCAQWDFGGLPARLLSIQGLQIRSSNELFLNQAKIYLQQLTKVIKTFIRTQSNPTAPILMIQVQNQPGFFTAQKLYISKLKQIFDDLNLQCPLYYDDTYQNLKDKDMYWPNSIVGMNVPFYQKAKFERFQSKQHYVVGGEIYSGWFSQWGEADKLQKQTRQKYKQKFIQQYSDLFQEKRSFSMYMAHGGTNFGLSAGYNMLTSYDYEAPINQQGLPTQKYHMFRTIKSMHDKSNLSSIPKPIQRISESKILGKTKFISSLLSNLLEGLQFPNSKITPLLFQSTQLAMFDQGIVVYQTTLSGPRKYAFQFIAHDIAIVYLDGVKIADYVRKSKILNEQQKQLQQLNVNCEKQSCKLQILIQALGHINAGVQMKNDRKGLLKFYEKNSPTTSYKWKYYKFNLDLQPQWKNQQKCQTAPCLYYMQMNLEEAKDMYIQPTQLKKGYIWVNGHNLGRYWNVGPQHRLYCPGVWLNKGKNKVLILEMYVAQQDKVIKAERQLA